jgi:CBS domain-containing protein
MVMSRADTPVYVSHRSRVDAKMSCRIGRSALDRRRAGIGHSMQAKDVMTRPVYTLRPEDTIDQAAALLAARNITSAPVVDSSGGLVGMVSEVDLIPHPLPGSREPLPGRSSPADTVAEVMTKNVAVVAPGSDLGDVAKAMLDHGVRCLPVLDEVELVGVVSRRDILRSLIRTDAVVQLEIQIRLDDYAGGERRWIATVADGKAVVTGEFFDEEQKKVVGILVRTTPGVSETQLRSPTG